MAISFLEVGAVGPDPSLIMASFCESVLFSSSLVSSTRKGISEVQNGKKGWRPAGAQPPTRPSSKSPELPRENANFTAQSWNADVKDHI